MFFENVVLLLINNWLMTIFIIILFIVLITLLILNSNLEDKRKFENNHCPYCNTNFGNSLRQSIIKTESETHNHYSCPRCLGEGKFLK